MTNIYMGNDLIGNWKSGASFCCGTDNSAHNAFLVLPIRFFLLIGILMMYNIHRYGYY